MSVIRRNRIAIGLAAGLAVVLGLGVWSATSNGANPNPVAQTETDLGVLGDYGDVGQPPVLQEPAQAPATETPAAPPQTQQPAAQPQEPAQQQAPANGIKIVGKAVPKMGNMLADGDGRTLYRFEKDTIGADPKSQCNGACATTWPPLLSDTVPQLEGVDPAIVKLITRADGKKQVAVGGAPLYTYSKDDKPGAWKGQGVGNTWFVAQPDGKRNLECLPAGTVVPPGA